MKVADTTVVWANSDAANTEKTVALTVPDTQPVGATLLVIIRSPSTVSTLNGQAQVQYDDGGTTRYAKLASFTVATANGDGEAFYIDGGILAAGARLSLKNVTALGGADGFTARVQAWAQ